MAKEKCAFLIEFQQAWRIKSQADRLEREKEIIVVVSNKQQSNLQSPKSGELVLENKYWQ